MNNLKTVEIKNIMGIGSLRFDAGAVTVISGGNGVGKTSILEAIRNVFHGGHDPAMIRHGADKGTITLTLNDGTVIHKWISRRGYDHSAKTAKGALIRPTKKFIDELAAGFAFDPIAMMDAKPAERLQFLLDVMPIEFTAAELAEALGDRALVEPCNLKTMEDIHAGIKDERKALNRAVRDLEGSIKTISDGLPDIDDGKDWCGEAATLAATLSEQKAELAAGRADINTQKELMKSKRRAEVQVEIDALKDQLDTEEKQIDEQAEKVYEEAAAKLQTEIDSITADLATAQEKEKAIERAAGARELLDTQRKQQKAKFFEAEALSNKLKALDALKKSKLANLPIPGLDIRGGDIFIEDTPWDKKNTSDLWLTVIQIGALASGKLPLLICDHAEVLEGARWEEFLEAIGKSGLQVITARVTEGALRVESAEQTPTP
jgi:DNA repair ATPase RecN